jgi:hypothetical protein
MLLGDSKRRRVRRNLIGRDPSARGAEDRCGCGPVRCRQLYPTGLPRRAENEWRDHRPAAELRLQPNEHRLGKTRTALATLPALDDCDRGST